MGLQCTILGLRFSDPFSIFKVSGETEAGIAAEQPARDNRTHVNGRRKLRLQGLGFLRFFLAEHVVFLFIHSHDHALKNRMR